MPEDYADAFPNSEKILPEAFALPDPAPVILSLIKAHPTYATIFELTVAYNEAAEATPSRAQIFAQALVAIRDAADVPPIQGDGSSLQELFYREIADRHRSELAVSGEFYDELEEEKKKYGPKNSYLINSLLSGLSFKYNLTSCSEQFGAITDGLDVNPHSNPAIAEIQVVGACIQLLTNGSGIVPAATSYIKSSTEVAAKLKDQKAAGTVKNLDGLKILELTITHADSGFKEENDIVNVWELLFPSQAA